jgi:hypothetical protein
VGAVAAIAGVTFSASARICGVSSGVNAEVTFSDGLKTLTVALDVVLASVVAPLTRDMIRQSTSTSNPIAGNFLPVLPSHSFPAVFLSCFNCDIVMSSLRQQMREFFLLGILRELEGRSCGRFLTGQLPRTRLIGQYIYLNPHGTTVPLKQELVSGFIMTGVFIIL